MPLAWANSDCDKPHLPRCHYFGEETGFYELVLHHIDRMLWVYKTSQVILALLVWGMWWFVDMFHYECKH